MVIALAVFETVRLSIAAAPASAGAASVSAAMQTLSSPAGFLLLAPSSWQPPEAAAGQAAPPESLKQSLVSADGKETLKVSVAAQTIQSSEAGVFVAIYLENVPGASPDLGPPRSIDVPGAGSGAVQTLRYTDGAGVRLAETVLVAATGTKLYVVELLTPDDYAVHDAGLLEAVLDSFQVVAPATGS